MGLGVPLTLLVDATDVVLTGDSTTDGAVACSVSGCAVLATRGSVAAAGFAILSAAFVTSAESFAFDVATTGLGNAAGEITMDVSGFWAAAASSRGGAGRRSLLAAAMRSAAGFVRAYPAV